MNTTRYISLDILRGLAIAIMIMGNLSPDTNYTMVKTNQTGIKKAAKKVKTGDPMNLVLWVSILCGSISLGMIAIEKYFRKRRGRHIRLFCPETRPFFQGARLTATVCHEMGFDTTIITDNMPAFVMQQEKVDVFTSAADVICMDGHVVNKVGTFQIAICADRLGVPYYVTGAPDFNHPGIDSVHIELRDPEEVLYARGVRTAVQGVKGYYPAFDITPPELVKGVVTDRGIYLPKDLFHYYDGVGPNDGPVV